MNDNENRNFPTEESSAQQDNANGLPHVPPSETTLETQSFQHTAQTAPFCTINAQSEISPTAYCNATEPDLGSTNAAPQLPLPREQASPSHNAYRDEPSAMSEAVRKKHFLLKGTRPLDGEPPHVYNSRMVHEYRLLHAENVSGFKASATKISLLLLLYIIIFQTVSITVPEIARAFGLLDDPNSIAYTVFIIILYLLIYPVTFPIVIYLGNLGETHKVKTYFQKPQCSPVYILKWFVIGAGCSYIVNIVFNIISTAIGYDNGTTAEPFTSVLDGASQLVVLCVFAPIFEELLFRGVMLSHHMKYGAWSACLITALYFGFFHGNLQQLLYTPVLGVIMAMVVLKTGSLISSIIIHVMVNFIGFIQILSLSLIDNYEEYIDGTALLPTGSPLALALFAFTTLIPWILMLAAVILILIELIKNPSAFKMPKGDSGLTANEKLTAFFTTPAVWTTVIVAILAIIFREVLLYLNQS